MCRPPTTPGQLLALLPHQPALALRSRCRGRCPRCVYVGGSSPPQPSRSVCPSPTGEAVASRTLRRGAPDRRGAPGAGGSRGGGLPGRGPWRRRVLEGAGSLIACQHALLLVHDPVPVEDRAARVSGEEPRPSFRDTRSSQGPPGVATSGAPSRRPPALVPDDRATVGSVWPMAAPVA